MLVWNPKIHNGTKMIARIVALLLPLVFLIPLLAQTTFAQTTTYVIIDGNETKAITTNETNPAEVLEDAGFTLGANDTYTAVPGDDIFQITVQRSQRITVHYCGKTLTLRSYGETLSALLSRSGLSVNSNHVVSLPMDTVTYDGMEVSVDNIVQTEQIYIQEIPFEVRYCYDPTLPAGQEKVLVSGRPGQQLVTANVTYSNAVEQSRTVLSQTVTKQPISKVVLIGTGENVGGTLTAPLVGDGVIITTSGEVLTYSTSQQFTTTAYTHTDAGCNTTTATGTTVRLGTVSVDPSVIPYGTRMFIISNDGNYVYGIGTAEDCGGAIKGNRLDLYFPTTDECWTYGVRDCTVYFLD